MPELKLRKELESLRVHPGNHPIHARELVRILGSVLDDLETIQKDTSSRFSAVATTITALAAKGDH